MNKDSFLGWKILINQKINQLSTCLDEKWRFLRCVVQSLRSRSDLDPFLDRAEIYWVKTINLHKLSIG